MYTVSYIDIYVHLDVFVSYTRFRLFMSCFKYIYILYYTQNKRCILILYVIPYIHHVFNEPFFCRNYVRFCCI